jgi:hypothetical protein
VTDRDVMKAGNDNFVSKEGLGDFAINRDIMKG